MQHLTLDLVGCREFPKKEILKRFLHALSISIQMTPAIPPIVEEFPGDKAGMTGVLVIKESHITFHTFEKAGIVYVDVFSCKHFPSSTVVEMFSGLFLPQQVHSNNVDRRPLRFPQEV